MENKCIFCGADLVDGKCANEPHFKHMCLNCNDCKEIDGKTVCINEDNQKAAINKIMEAVPSGYEIETLSLKPLALKDATKKCKKWHLVETFTQFLTEAYQ